MRLKNNQIENFVNNPNPQFNLILIHGNAPDKIIQYSNTLISKLGGKNLNEEMRLIKLSERQVLNDSEVLFKELKTKSFFSGPKLVLVESTSDKSKNIVEEIIKLKLTNPETFLLLLGENMSSNSPLKKLIEGQPDFAITVGAYQRDLNTLEIKDMLTNRGLKVIDHSCLTILKEISETSGIMNLNQALDKLQLAFLEDERALSKEDIESVVLEETVQNYFLIVENVANGQITDTIKEFRKYAAGRQNFSSLISFLLRYFKNIQATKVKTYTRIPYFGKAKEKFESHLKIWSVEKTDKVINLIFDTNIQLREKSYIQHKIKVERMLMNICSFIN